VTTDAPTAAQIEALRRSFEGDIIRPSDAAFDDARRVWNAIHDRRPGVILRPRDAADVATAIRFGRERGLEIAVRSGAHSATGHSTTDGGLVIDLQRLRGVTVDPERQTARVNGGALLGELDIAAQQHGLVCPVGVIGHTGVAGLTLGGGIGRLQRNFGLTIDNLRAVELVTADGRAVRASPSEEPDLFWGLRGAGPNFGVATAFEFDLHPFDGQLHRGTLAWPASQAQAVWSMVREFAPAAPDALSFILVLGRSEAGDTFPESLNGQPIVIVGYNHSGDAAAVERDVAPLLSGPAPVFSTHGTAPYLDVQTAHDLAMGWGHRTLIESAYANDVSPGTIDALVAHTAAAPADASFSITVHGGAIARVADDAMAYTGRSAAFDVSADATWDDPGLDELNIEWVRSALSIVEPDLTVGRYVNGITRDDPNQARAVYGEAKLARLQALKRTWDPDNVFRRNHNIVPAP
jgi:FAD/FMN-containing dehydrogenase